MTNMAVHCARVGLCLDRVRSVGHWWTPAAPLRVGHWRNAQSATSGHKTRRVKNESIMTGQLMISLLIIYYFEQKWLGRCSACIFRVDIFPLSSWKKRGYLYANPLLNKRNKNSARSSCVLLMMRTSVLCFSGRRRNLLKKTKKGRKLPTRPEIPLIAYRSVEFFLSEIEQTWDTLSQCPKKSCTMIPWFMYCYLIKPHIQEFPLLVVWNISRKYIPGTTF